MAISKVKALQASVRSFRSTVEGAKDGQKTRVSIQLAQHYNALRQEAAGFDALREHLPPRINTHSKFNMVGDTDVRYTDLMVYLNQLVALTDLLEDEAGKAG
jgi:hypothetical protein